METAIVRVQDLRRSGATDREIRAAVRPLSSLAPGAYADVRGLTPEADHLLRAQAVVSRLSDTALSHISAAVALDLPAPRTHLATVHVSPGRQREGNPKSRPGYHLHTRSLAPAEVEDLAGTPVTRPIRTVIDCAASVPLDWAVAAADAALRRQLFTQADLQHQAGAQRRVQGAARMRLLPELASPLAESPGESLLRMRLHRMGLSPDEQVTMPHVVGNPRVDFLIDGRLVIEFDGQSKYQLQGDSEQAHWAEKLRHDRLVEAGYTVIHVVWADLWDEPALRARVNRALRLAHARPDPSGSPC